MVVKLLDTITGDVVEASDIDSSFQWAENNWSCDCNRCTYFGLDWEDLGEEEGFCYGEKRFLVVAVIKPTRDYYTLKDYNSGYPQELLTKHNISDKSPLDGTGVNLDVKGS